MTDAVHTMTVQFKRLRPEQVLALRAMFDRWEILGSVGSSRPVAYFVDGDGTFHPIIDVEDDLDEDLTDVRREAAEPSSNLFDHGRLVREFRDDLDSLDQGEPK